MATDRRKFLALLALGVPTATVAGQDLTSAIQDDGRTRAGFDSMPLDLISGVEGHLWDAVNADGASVRITHRYSSDCPTGKIRWAIEIEEPDGKSNTILGKHPRVLLVFSKSILVLHRIALEQAGCVVDCVSDSDAAIKMYRERWSL